MQNVRTLNFPSSWSRLGFTTKSRKNQLWPCVQYPKRETCTPSPKMGWCLIFCLSSYRCHLCKKPQPLHRKFGICLKQLFRSNRSENFVAKNTPYFQDSELLPKKTTRITKNNFVNEALWLPFLLASSWHGHQAAYWKSWKQDIEHFKKSCVVFCLDVFWLHGIYKKHQKAFIYTVYIRGWQSTR